jgi:hAT family C-terminal dimerisation region
LLSVFYIGRYGALWEVLPTIESLLKDVKVFVDRYSPDVDSSDPSHTQHWNPMKDRYLRNNLQLGWQKLDKYYRLTDDSCAYVAAIALHPRYKWRWIEKKWAEHIDWQIAADSAIRKQWESYKSKKIDELLAPNEVELYKHQKGQHKQMSQLEYFMEEDFETSSDEEEQGQIDEYTEWQKIGREKHVDEPVTYWYERRCVWPHLASFALDLFAVPAMSAEPERVFSSTGRMVRPDRGCLKADVIGAAACLKQWDRNGIIKWE